MTALARYRQRLPLALAIASLVLTILLLAGHLLLGIQRGSSVPGVVAWVPTEVIFPLNSLGFALAGVLVAWRKPDNRMWMVLCAAGLAGMLFGFTTEWTIFALLRHTGTVPGGEVTAWVSTWGFQPIMLTIALIMFLYPTGRPLPGRWSRALWLFPAYIVTGLLGSAFLPAWPYNLSLDRVTAGDPGPVHNPLFLKSAEGFFVVWNNIGTALLVVTLAVAIASLVARYRGGDAEQRQQLKVFLFAGIFAPLSWLLWPVYAGTNGFSSAVGVVAFTIATVAAVGMPLGIAVAIIKYRLYDVDVVISRTLVYGALAVLITGVYVGIAVGIGELVGSGGKPNLGLSILATAIVAVGFQPARERLQRLANRLVYGRRATPYQALSEFSANVAGSYAGDDVLSRMARVLQEATGARTAHVWLRSGTALHPAAMFPVTHEAVLPLSMRNGTLPLLPSVTRAVEVRHQGELLGALTLTKRRGESLTPVEEKLLDDLAHQAGLVLKNVGLTADLQRRLEELRASRQRLVSAQDAERRRLERNLHDGAQQHLVALKVKLGLAEMLTAKDPEKAKATITQLKADTDEALETLRDLARGIYPPLLAEKGLVTALESQARKATLPVTVEADGVGRYPQELEATVYFCVLEALQNVQKYAQASHATVRLRDADRTLRFEVEDDGRGFDVEHVKKGAGLTNMNDRLDALGGAIEIDSKPAHGCRVHGALPVSKQLAAAAPGLEHAAVMDH
jgi:signal transduction histidine kinase